MRVALHRLGQGILLLLLPALTWVAAEVGRDVRGPFYLGANQDPSYSYLLGSMRLGAQGKTAFFDHPGLTTQAIGAGVLAVTHGLRPAPQENAALDPRLILPRDVLSHPELYLRAIQLTILAAVVSAFAAAGILAWRGGDPIAGLLLQTSPFLTALGLESLSQVGPESTLMFAAAAMSLTVWRFAAVAPDDEWTFALAFGAITAFAVATRFSALSFIVIPPLLLRSWRGRLVFSATAAVGGALALMIVDQRWKLLATLLFHGRRTGSVYRGEQRSLLEPSLYSEGVVSLFHRHYSLFAVVGLALAVLLWHTLRRPATRHGLFQRALAAVLLGQAAQILIVSKTPVARYLLPATALAALVLALVWALISGDGRRIPTRWRPALAILLLALPLALELPRHESELRRLRRDAVEQHVIATEISKLPADCRVVEFYRASSIPYALHFGQRTLPKAASHLLTDLYPEKIFYNHYRRMFEDYNGLILASEVERRHPCIALHGHFRPELAANLIRRTEVESLFSVPSVDTITEPPASQ